MDAHELLTAEKSRPNPPTKSEEFVEYPDLIEKY